MPNLKTMLIATMLIMAMCASATVHTVTVSSFQFAPATVTIQLGDTIVWNNTGGTHNVHHTGNPTLFHSGAAAAAPWTYQYPNATETEPLPVGSHPYVCQPHAPGMAGTVVVQAAGVRDEPRAAGPDDFVLAQNFPNPFNGSTTIEFALPQSALVKLSVYNVLGEQVRTLLAGQLSAGNHRVEFDGSGMSTGIYYYVIETPAATLTRKMVYAK